MVNWAFLIKEVCDSASNYLQTVDDGKVRKSGVTSLKTRKNSTAMSAGLSNFGSCEGGSNIDDGPPAGAGQQQDVRQLVLRQPIAVSDISVYICLIDIRSKSKEQLNERRAGLSICGVKNGS